MIFRNKKGSVTVFICVFFVSLVWLILIFAGVSKEKAAAGSTRALCSLWADSVLAEYDLNLQGRYQLFGFYGYPAEVKEKLAFYAKDSFDRKKYIDYQVKSCSLYDYSLVNTDVFARQIEAAGKLAFTEKFQKPERTITPVHDYTGPSAASAVFEDLPSEGSGKGYSLSAVKNLLSSASSIGEALEKSGENWHVNQYIFAYFKDAADDKGLGPTYLNGEIEYIICGKKSDSANQRALKRRIVALREAMNLAYLLKDSVKSNEALLAAELLTPGPAALVTQKALLSAWALAESYNDYQLLVHGKKVPVMKSEQNWAVDLESVIANQTDGYIDTGADTGETYGDYLRLFTYTMDAQVRLLRMMDLIQINMRRFYYEDFLLREYNGGLAFVMTVNGKDYETERAYEHQEKD